MAATRRIARVYRSLNPFPNSKLVRHKYCDAIGLGSLSAGLGHLYQFRANSNYDVDYTGTGHQPMYNDEMAAKYASYTVLSSKIKITIAGTNAQELVYALYPDNDGVPPTNLNDLMEQHGTVLQRPDRLNGTFKLRAWFDAAKWAKTSRSAYLAENDNKVGSGTNPPTKSVVFYNFQVIPLIPSVAIAGLNFKVEVTYITLWRDPYEHTGS